MGCPRTTGGSHNKTSATYNSKRTDNAKKSEGQAQCIKDYFRTASHPEAPPIVSVDCSSDCTTTSSSTSSASGATTSTNVGADGDNETGAVPSHNKRQRLNANDDTHDSENSCMDQDYPDGRKDNRQAKWEIQFPFLCFSVAKMSWTCKICTEYSDVSGCPWRGDGVDPKEHPMRVFRIHEQAKGHTKAVQCKTHVQSILRRGTIHRQLVDAALGQEESVRERNRRVIKKFIKTAYFLAKKKWAVRENFKDLIEFIGELGDIDISLHTSESSIRATYLSKNSVDDYLQVLSDYIESKQLDLIISSGEFSLLADETTDIASRPELSIYIRFVDPNNSKIREEFIGLVHLKEIDSKGAESLCKEIKCFLESKHIDISLLMFSGLDGTNAMSGEISGLQSRLRHLSPHAIYANCRNHRLALVFVHLIKQYDILKSVDALIISVNGLFKNSNVRKIMFDNSQECEGLKPVKLLRAAATRWLSHGDATKRLITRFIPLLNSLDTMINETADPEVMGVRNQLLQPNVILFLLMLSDLLMEINKFSKFLQKRNLVYNSISNKFAKLKETVSAMKDVAGPLFEENASNFLTEARERTTMSRRHRDDKHLTADANINSEIKAFNADFREPFISSVLVELNSAIGETNEVFSSFDAFSLSDTVSSHNRKSSLKLLFEHYGKTKSSKVQFDVEIKTSAALIAPWESVNPATITLFYNDFDNARKAVELRRNKEIADLIRSGKLNARDAEDYRDAHTVSLGNVYAEMYEYPDRDNYMAIMKLFKFALLIPPSTANVERGFSALSLLHTRTRNRLSPNSLDKLMRIVLVGIDDDDEAAWDQMVDTFAGIRERRIDL